MATLRIFIMGSDTIIKAKINNATASLIIANFIKCGVTCNVHKYNTDDDILMEDTAFYFEKMIFVITREDFK